MTSSLQKFLVLAIVAVLATFTATPADAVALKYTSIKLNGVESTQVSYFDNSRPKLEVDIVPLNPAATMLVRDSTMDPASYINCNSGHCWFQAQSYASQITITVRIQDPDSTYANYVLQTIYAYPEPTNLAADISYGSTHQNISTINNNQTNQIAIPLNQTSVTITIAATPAQSLSSFRIDTSLEVTGATISGLDPGHNFFSVWVYGTKSSWVEQDVFDIFRGTPENNPLGRVQVNGVSTYVYTSHSDTVHGDQTLQMNVNSLRLEPGVLHAYPNFIADDPYIDSWSEDTWTWQNLVPGLNWANIAVTSATFATEQLSFLVYAPTDPYGPWADAAVEVGFYDPQNGNNWASYNLESSYSYSAGGNLANHYNSNLTCRMADESSYSICNVAWDNYFQDDLIDPTIQFEIGVATITTTGPNGMNYLSTVQFVPDSMTWQQILDADVQSHSIDVVINGSYVRPWSVTYVPEGTSSVNVDVIPESGYFDYAFSGGSELVPGYNALTVKANNGHILLYQIYVGGAVDSGIVIPPAPTPTPTQQIVYMTPNIDIKNVSSPNTLMAEILNDVLNVHLSMASITNAKQFEVAVSLDGKNWFSRLETPAQPTSKNQQFAIPGFSNVKELQVKVRTVSENAQSIWTDVVTWKAAALLKAVGKKITANLNTNSANLSLATRAKLIQELMTQKLWTQKSAIVSYSVAGLAKRQKAFLLSQVRELVSLLKLGDYSIKTKVIQSKKPPALIISMTGLH